MRCSAFMEQRNQISPIRFSFNRVLPQPVCHALSAFPSIDLRQWTCEADRLMADYDDCQPTIAAVRTSSPTCQNNTPPTPETSPTVAATSAFNWPRRRLVPPSRIPCEERVSFGASARNCCPPCAWQGNALVGPR